ncbi:MAG: DUF362 domain-containing protein [Elusimicrobia bacterium]|nr:DUF362 domain-containing protein [Elusimicrobiota bacterium]
MPTVSLIKCNSYQNAEASIKEAIRLIGGTEKFFKSGQRILIKPNILSAKTPDKAVTTHPEVVRAIIRIVKNAGAIPAVGESPGGAIGGAEKVWQKSGIGKVCEEENCEMLFFEKTGTVFIPSENPNNKMLKTIEIAKPCIEYDCVISVPKFKTHNLVFLTGAIKNTYGCVPGLRKSMYHKIATHPDEISEVIVDIFAIVKPKLSIMDAVVGMEGDGPGSGTPRKIGLIMASSDSVALDTVMGEIAGCDLKKLYYLNSAASLGLGCNNIKKINIAGENLNSVKLKDFSIPENFYLYLIPKPFAKFLGKFVSAVPVMDKQKCTKCKICIKSCPTNAIKLYEIPRVDKSKCILCLCCNELCPENAVAIKHSLFIRIFILLRNIKRLFS